MNEFTKKLNVIDRFLGPTTDKFGYLLMSIGAISLALLITPLVLQIPTLNILQYLVLYSLALDLGGGVVANSLESTKRWYHREGRSNRNHLNFILIHGIHIIVVVLVFNIGFDFLLFWILFFYIIAIISLKTSVEYRMALILAFFPFVFLINQAFFSIPIYLSWFIPILYLKLHGGHLIPPR
jgi:hypothetical protein